MTKEEAIEMLNYIKRIGNGEGPYKNDAQSIALDMAISALSENKGDLISRQAVLDIWHTSYSDIREENEEIQYKKIAFELPSVENKGEWIPVTERLPKPKDKQEVKVIVSYENEDGEFVTKGMFSKRYGFNFPSVKAWQPLPETYKPEKGGE